MQRMTTFENLKSIVSRQTTRKLENSPTHSLSLCRLATHAQFVNARPDNMSYQQASDAFAPLVNVTFPESDFVPSASDIVPPALRAYFWSKKYARSVCLRVAFALLALVHETSLQGNAESLKTLMQVEQLWKLGNETTVRELVRAVRNGGDNCVLSVQSFLDSRMHSAQLGFRLLHGNDPFASYMLTPDRAASLTRVDPDFEKYQLSLPTERC